MNDVQDFITIKNATKTYGISSRVLRTWESKGCLQSTRSPLGTRIYRRSDLELALGINRNATSKKQNFCYCRVSSAKQQDDLQRQAEFLGSLYPEHTLIKDVGSGINYSRKGLHTILESAMQRNIGEVVVAYKDRLARFGFELIESIVEKGGGKITILDNQSFKSREEELSDDLLAIVHVFSCRKMGQRRYRCEETQTQNLSNATTEEGASQLVRNVSVCV